MSPLALCYSIDSISEWNHVLIVLESVDCGGKNYLVQRLGDYHGWHRTTVFHQGPPPPDVDLVRHYEEPLLRPASLVSISSSDHLVILNRWETGELIYGPLLRTHSRLSPGQALHVELLIRSLGGVRLLAQPADFQVVLDRYDQRGDRTIKREDLKAIWEFYEDHAKLYDDWIRPDTFFTWENVYQVAPSMAHLAESILSRFPGYVGGVDPELLFVGERRANWPMVPPHAGAWNRTAFTPVGHGGSSRWLLDRLVELDEVRRIGLCNAFEPGQDLGALWQALGQPAVVALGAEAAAELRTINILYSRVHHPSWARRFRSKYPDEYAQEIKEAIAHERARIRDRRSGVPHPVAAGA